MPYIKYALVIAIASLLVSSCTMTYPGSSAATPTTNPFTNPLPTSGDPMKNIESFATATALAKTAIAENGGLTATPGADGATPVPTDTPFGGSIPTNTPLGGVGVIPSSTPGIGGSGEGDTPTSTLAPVTGRPANYTLQQGEFPYCIARRFNVNPEELLSLNGLYDGSLYMPGTMLQIPQSGSFPGPRALRSHPTTHTVASSDETFYSIACLFGDVDPASIAQANGLSLGSLLTIGQAIKIP